MDGRVYWPRSRRGRWAAVAVITVLVLVGTLVPLPGDEDRLPEPFGIGPDKVVHVVAHAAVSGSLAAAIEGRDGSRPVAGVVATLGVGGVGVATEFLQVPVRGREYELADVGVNWLGAALGTVAWWVLDRPPGESGD